MAYHTVYGIGGYNPDLPNNNIIEQTETPDPPADVDIQALAEALTELPVDVLLTLQNALQAKHHG